MVRPTISAVAATVSTAVIQRRIRRVIAVSPLLDASPRSADQWWFEAAAPADGAASPGTKTPARRPDVDRAASLTEACPGSPPPPDPCLWAGWHISVNAPACSTK